MFNGSFLRVCRILQFVKKLDFAFLSLADQAMVPVFGVSNECQRIGTSGKKYWACYLAPKPLSWCIF